MHVCMAEGVELAGRSCRKGPQRMEGDPGSRIATEAARLALQESQQGAPESLAGSSAGGSGGAAAGVAGLDTWGGEAVGGSFWDLDAAQDPAEGSGAKQAPPQSRWGFLL